MVITKLVAEKFLGVIRKSVIFVHPDDFVLAGMERLIVYSGSDNDETVIKAKSLIKAKRGRGLTVAPEQGED